MATHSIHKELEELDKDLLSEDHKSADNEEPDGPIVSKAYKTKAAMKKKNNVTKTSLQEEIKANRKRVPTQAARLKVRDVDRLSNITSANHGTTSTRMVGVVIKRKLIMFTSALSSLFVLNEFSLFFHNRRLETPATKKNVNNSVVEWAEHVSPPSSPPPKKRKILIPPLVTSKSSSSLVKSASTKPTSCAVVSTSTANVLKKKPVPGAKRRAEELEYASDVYDEVQDMAVGGLDEDEDDTMEQAAAASSPIRASAAAQRSKVSHLYIFTAICYVLPHGIAEIPQHTHWDHNAHSSEDIKEANE